MVAKYNDPARTLRDWAAPLRASQPDVWNELEDLAQSIEAAIEGASDAEHIKELERELEELEDETGESRKALGNAWEVIDNALALVGGGKVRDIGIQDACDELQRLARRALSLSALFDALGMPLKHDEVYCAAAAGDDLLPWAKTRGAELRQRLDRLDALEKWAGARP